MHKTWTLLKGDGTVQICLPLGVLKSLLWDLILNNDFWYWLTTEKDVAGKHAGLFLYLKRNMSWHRYAGITIHFFAEDQFLQCLLYLCENSCTHRKDKNSFSTFLSKTKGCWLHLLCHKKALIILLLLCLSTRGPHCTFESSFDIATSCQKWSKDL